MHFHESLHDKQPVINFEHVKGGELHDCKDLYTKAQTIYPEKAILYVYVRDYVACIEACN